jgi:hypothetical protein
MKTPAPEVVTPPVEPIIPETPEQPEPPQKVPGNG